MHKLIALFAIAMLVVVGTVLVSQRTTAVTNQTSTQGATMDIMGLTKNAKDLPVESFPAH